MNGFTVSVVCFGDHFKLHHRCLGSLVNNIDTGLVRSLRIGLNAVCPDTLPLVDSVARLLPPEMQVLVYNAGEYNRLKYPMLRKMFFDPQHPVLTPFTMHFDDDSFLDWHLPKDWWETVHQRMQASDLLGSVYRMPGRDRQWNAVKQQPWYTGKPIPVSGKFTFATGGWWTIRTRILQEWDYPFPPITHNGGDVMLGELIRQQGLRLVNFHDGVKINADENGVESKAPRRGVSSQPIWYDFQPGRIYDVSHHCFEVPGIDPRIQPLRQAVTSRPTRRKQIPGL